MHDIDKLKAIPIEDVAKKLGMKVGRGHLALCPFHADRVASLHFGKDKRHWKCFACNKSGDQLSLVMEYLALPFVKACEWLEREMSVAECHAEQQWGCDRQEKPAKECVVDREYLEWITLKPMLNEAARLFLFEQRKLDPKVVEMLGITSIDRPLPCTRWGKAFYDAPSLLIPYRDVAGKLLTVQGRKIKELKDEKIKEFTPRFRFPPGSQVGMYNKPVLRRLRDGDELWITEGPSDCWAMLSAGRKAVAIPSATSLTVDDVSLLREGLPKGVSLHMMPDNDRPGMELFQTLKRSLPQLQGHVLPDGVKDFGQWYASVGADK